VSTSKALEAAHAEDICAGVRSDTGGSGLCRGLGAETGVLVLHLTLDFAMTLADLKLPSWLTT